MTVTLPLHYRYITVQLDFLHEKVNLERCGAFFAAGGGGGAPGSGGSARGTDRHDLAGKVVVPEVVGALSSSRVLTMTFEGGCRLTDHEGLARAGLSPTAVTRLLSEAFCAQIFHGGFVHCECVTAVTTVTSTASA